jgi:hypothetical protein
LLHEEWGNVNCRRQFPVVAAMPELQRLCCMCFASLCYHQKYITDTLPVNHPVRFVSYFLRDSDVQLFIASDENLVRVTYPWNDDLGRSYSGVPPHIALMQELAFIRHEQKDLVELFVAKVRIAIDESGLTGSGVMENRL